MRILTLENCSYDLDHLPEQVEDMRFAILDNSDPANPDYHYIPLIFLESFTGPAVVLKIGPHEVTMPLDWCCIVGDPTGPDMEVLPITSLNDRGFEALLYNPLSSFRLEFRKIEIVNFYNDVKWYFPKMKNGQLLATPITNSVAPLCAYFVKEISRQSEIIYLDRLF